MGIVLRDYQSVDIDAVIAVFQDAVRASAARDYNPAQIEAWVQIDSASWHELLMNSVTRVASVNDKVVGFANVEYNGHLNLMYVHPEFQGLGAASALLKNLEDEVRKMDIPVIFTEASISAKAFFSANGFALIDAQLVEVRGESMINYRMSKVL